jgi:predicted PurR-regulated permease PerM
MFKFRRPANGQEYTVTISNETFIRLAFLTLILIVLLLAIHRATHALLLIFVAFFLTLALNAPVYWLSKQIPGKRRGSRAVATTVSFLIVIVLLGLFLAGVVPPLVRQTNDLINAAPRLIRDLHNENSGIGRVIHKYHLQNEVNAFSNQLESRLKDLSGTAISSLSHILNSAFSVLVILALTFMMLVEGPRWIVFGRQLVPAHQKALTDDLAYKMYNVVRGFVNGQVLLAALASILITPAILLLGISYPAALIVVIFVCGLIPLVGHTIGAIIVTLVALFHSTSAAVIILIYYILYQQIENYIIQPRLQANTTKMSPLTVFMSLTIGVSFGGIFGGLLAIPIGGCIRIAFLEYLRSRNMINDQEFAKAVSKGTKD